MKLATVSMCLNTLISSNKKIVPFSLFNQNWFILKARELAWPVLFVYLWRQTYKRENISLEKSAFFGKSDNLPTIIDPKRWFLWKSLNRTSQPLITASWDQLITLPTVVNYFLLFTVLSTCRSDYYRHTPSMNVHIRSDKLAHKQPAPKLWSLT